MTPTMKLLYCDYSITGVVVMNQEEFLAAAQQAHGDRYDYSEVVYSTRKTKVRIRCRQHDTVFEQIPGNHVSGAGCPLCGAERRAAAAKSRRVPVEEFIARAVATHGDRYDYSKAVYIGKGAKVTIVCPKHGEFQQAPAAHTAGRGCPACCNEARTGKLADAATQIAKFAAKHPTLDFTAAEYFGAREPLTAVCPEHGPVTKPAYYWNTYGCPDCGRARSLAAPKRTDQLRPYNDARMYESERNFWEFAKANAERFDFSKARFVKQDAPVEVRCRKHDVVFYPTVRNLMLSGQGCARCGAEAISVARSRTQEDVLAEFVEVHGDKYDYSGVEYSGRHEKVRIRCRKHDHEFMQTPGNHIQGGGGCPVCAASLSKNEAAIADWLESLGVVVERRNRSVLAPKEIDIWLPGHKIGIEYHGLYWHTEDRVGNAHREKWELAQKAGIRLIQVFEDEWANKEQIIKARLQALIGRASKVAARKCSVVTLSHAQAAVFLNTYHIQGIGPAASVYLGLESGGELAAVATFGKGRSGAMVARGGWEVLRYASRGTVVGGFGKLFSEFLRREAPSEVVSYCDLRYGDGRLYAALGFTLDAVTEPDYWWLPSKNTTERVSRYQTQKHKIAKHPVLKEFYSPDLSERAICEAAGWKQVLGVGNQRWIWRKLDVPA